MALTAADDVFVDESKDIDSTGKQAVRVIAADERDALMKAIGQQEIVESPAETRDPEQASGERQAALSNGVSPQGAANSEDEETEEEDDELDDDEEDEDLEEEEEEDDELEDEDVDDEDDEDADDEEEDEEEDGIPAPTAPANGKRGNT